VGAHRGVLGSVTFVAAGVRGYDDPRLHAGPDRPGCSPANGLWAGGGSIRAWWTGSRRPPPTPQSAGAAFLWRTPGPAHASRHRIDPFGRYPPASNGNVISNMASRGCLETIERRLFSFSAWTVFWTTRGRFAPVSLRALRSSWVSHALPPARGRHVPPGELPPIAGRGATVLFLARGPGARVVVALEGPSTQWRRRQMPPMTGNFARCGGAARKADDRTWSADEHERNRRADRHPRR
jgi:hypothetical protein